MQHHIQDHIFNTFSTNLHSNFFQLNVNFIQNIWIELNTMSFDIFIEMELNFHKKLLLLFINWLLLVRHSTVEPKFLTKRFKLTSTTTPLSVEWFCGYNSLIKLGSDLN
jgi:hypothetical protein